MKKVININFQGQVIAIEETAYEILNKYIGSLKKYFSREEGGDEIVNDIENRIAELFGNRLRLGINCITDEDVESIINNIGRPEDFDTEYDESAKKESEAFENTANEYSFEDNSYESDNETKSLYRNSKDKILGGVCSGLAHYFKTDPVWLRLIFLVFFGFLFSLKKIPKIWNFLFIFFLTILFIYYFYLFSYSFFKSFSYSIR